MAGKKRVRARKKVGLAGAPLDKGWPTFKFYVHYQCDDKECHEIAKNYVRRNFSKGEAQAILVHPKHTIASHDFAAMLHWINLGNDFPESYARAPEYISNLFADLIKSGDYLTSSDMAGLAQLSKHPGPVIGYAVTNQKQGEDTVEILLQPGNFYFPKHARKPRTKMVNGQPIKSSRER